MGRSAGIGTDELILWIDSIFGLTDTDTDIGTLPDDPSNETYSENSVEASNEAASCKSSNLSSPIQVFTYSIEQPSASKK